MMNFVSRALGLTSQPEKSVKAIVLEMKEVISELMRREHAQTDQVLIEEHKTLGLLNMSLLLLDRLEVPNSDDLKKLYAGFKEAAGNAQPGGFGNNKSAELDARENVMHAAQAYAQLVSFSASVPKPKP